ncbi:MAG TPA: lipopolysaccharide biosynthesis protein [Sphingomicrobium sp.]|nr:lipopolysaccharide biosynthesis protein [Sphingomicrobium sp.]
MLRRALRNAGLLLTGKAAAGLMQLATFAIAARSLGLTDFGNLSVMLAGIQLLIVLATFQSNQAIVRYGVLHLNSADRPAFQRMVKLGVLLDLAAAAAAVAAALLLAPIIAERASWTARQTDAWRLLALLPVTIALATPKGLLRLFGRFDLLARHVTVTPLARLAGAVVLAVTGAGLMGWVVMWLIAGLAGVLVAFWLAVREARRRHLLGGMTFDFRRLREGNPGMIRFAMLSNLHSSLIFLPGHIATFSVGMVLGPQSAGLMKVAQELGSGLAKPIDLINQAVYPDIARLAAENAWQRVRKLVRNAGTTAAALSLLVTLVLLVAGRPGIGLIFGKAFEGAHALLVLISLATSLSVSVFAVDATLYAIGKPSRPLATAVIANLLFVTVMFAAFGPLGLLAPGAAWLAAGTATLVLSLVWLAVAVPRSGGEPAA